MKHLKESLQSQQINELGDDNISFGAYPMGDMPKQWDNPFSYRKSDQFVKDLKKGLKTFYDECMFNIELDEMDEKDQKYVNKKLNDYVKQVRKEIKYLVPLIEQLPRQVYVSQKEDYYNMVSQIKIYIEGDGVQPSEIKDLFNYCIESIGGRRRARWDYPDFLKTLRELMLTLNIDSKWEWPGNW